FAMFVFRFFFQAEDGIRDSSVTGVQTCALPIYGQRFSLAHPDSNIDHRRVPNLMVFFQRKGESLSITARSEDYAPGDLVTWDLRSEERRVGKEWRYGRGAESPNQKRVGG